MASAIGTAALLRDSYARMTECARDDNTQIVRQLNNLVKACVIEAACGTVDGAEVCVADIGCGRGQDVSKWVHGARACGKTLRSMYCIDVVPENVAAATRMMHKFLSRDTQAQAVVGDVTAAGFIDCAAASVNVLSCQLAFHYFFGACAHVRLFFKECARVLKPGGVVIVTFADGRSIVRRGRAALASMATPAAPPSRLVVVDRMPLYRLDIPTALLQRRLVGAAEAPFGLQYTFTMPGSVEGVPEMLVHERTMTQQAQAQGGLAHVRSYALDALARWLLRECVWAQRVAAAMFTSACAAELQRCADEAAVADAMGLYRLCIFTADADVLTRWRGCIKTGGSGSDGLDSR